jgi:hypothetical protein
MKNEFVTYEQALALKELGFKEDCLASYYHAGKRLGIGEYNNHGNYTILAPLKQQVFRWFREKYDLFISIMHYENGYSINDLRRFDTYEEAENACIDKLIEMAK